MKRAFTAVGINELWLTDIPLQAGCVPSEHHTDESKLYMCAVKDVFSNKIVGYAIDSRMKSRLAAAAIDDAVARRGEAGVIAGRVVHSDRGSQFRSRRFWQVLKCQGLIGSMGRVGAAGDNAAMESFFAVVQKNVLDRACWDTRAQLRTAIVHWVERTYHRKRQQRRLNKLTPVEYELVHHKAVALAA